MVSGVCCYCCFFAHYLIRKVRNSHQPVDLVYKQFTNLFFLVIRIETRKLILIYHQATSS